MSIEQAIWKIKQVTLYTSDSMQEANKLAIAALERQIPKRVNKASENKLNTNLCPVCSREVRIGQFYCETCGQKLNWD